MRNLKRALSLALASVMLLGMMVVGSSAASFPDVDDKDNVEAIEVLKAVNVMIGDNGYFKPDEKVTRNEMAVIMTNMLGLNAKDFAGACPFTDVSPWAQDYVAACYANGIIAGRSATVFDGQATVTAVEAAAMMMRALGYFQYAEDYSNNGGFVAATVKQAASIRLFDGISSNANSPMDRNDVAQLALNTLEADVVEATGSKGMEIDMGDGKKVNVGYTIKYEPKTDDYGTTGYNYSNDPAPGGGVVKTHQQDYLQLCEKLYDGKLRKTTDDDDFGAPATKWLYEGKEVGKYANEATVVYLKAVKSSDIYKDLGLSADMAAVNVKFVIDGVDDGAVRRIYANDGTTDLNGVQITKNGANKDVKVGGKGAVTKVFYDSNAATDKIVVSITNYYLAKASEDYDTKDEEVDLTVRNVKGSSTPATITVKNEDVAVSNVKKDDYLVVTVASSDNGSTYAVKTAAPAETVENVVVTAARDADYVTAGQKYEYSDISEVYQSALGRSLMNDATTYTLNDENSTYNLYLDPNGFVLGVEGYDGGVNMSNYLFVKETNTNGFDVIAKALFSDGTTKTITVSKVNLSGTEVDATNTNFGASVTAVQKKFYKFTISGDKYKLTDIGQVTDVNQKVPSSATDYSTVDSKVNPITGTGYGAPLYADKDTLFVAKDKVSTGVKNAPKVTAANNLTYCLFSTATGSSNRLLWVYADKTGSVVTSVEDLVYVIDDKPTVSKSGDDSVYTYRVWKNGEETTIDANDASAGEGLYKVDTYTNGRADLGSNITSSHDEFITGVAGTGYGYTFSEPVLDIEDMSSYILKDNVKVYTVEDDTVKTVSPSTLGKKTATDGFTNVILIKEKNEANADIAVVYVIKGGDTMTGSTTEIASGTANVTNITAAFATSDTVKVTGGALTIGAKLEIPDDKTLEVVTGGITGDYEIEVTGTLKVTGNVASSTTGVTVKAGGSAEITGDVTKVANVEATGSLTVKGNKTIATVTDCNGTITVEGTGSITTVSDLSAGTINANIGTLADVTNAATTTATINGNVTTDVTNINSSGNVIFKGTVAKVTDITTGTVTFENNVTQVLDISGGTVTFKKTAAITSAATLGTCAIHLSETTSQLTVGTASNETISLANATIDGVAGAKIVIASNAVTPKANTLFAADGSTARDTTPAAETYTCNSDGKFCGTT